MENLFYYLRNHYGFTYIPIKVQETLRELNNGTNNKYLGITISYDKMCSMLKYYQRELFELYKRNVDRGKCKEKTQRMLYDIRVMVDWLEKYDNRPEVRYYNATHSKAIDGGEAIFDNSKFIGEWHYRNLRKQGEKLAKEAEQVKRLLAETEDDWGEEMELKEDDDK
ncbi:MAG: hypothetical protein HFJ52_07140 [Clostridia bacterium]|nr:hypothetical protein [Clostridia bacterium]